MRKKVKIWLIIAISLVFIGCILFGSVMTMLNWDFTKLSTVKYETNNHEVIEHYKNISIKTNTADISFVPSNNAKCSVVCHEQKNANHSVAVKDDTLIIEVNDTRKWYEHIGVFFGTPKITVYIPQGEYGALSIQSGTGDVEIPKDFKYESINIQDSTGDVTNYASASGAIKIKTSTGNICAENISAGILDLSVSTGNVTVTGTTCEGDLNISVSTGRTNLTDIICKNIVSRGSTGALYLTNVAATEKFSIERSTGDVKFNNCDAAEIFVKTDTGDITGSLLSEKVFITQSNTGKIDIPKTTTGGICQINTHTGNIIISISY